MHYLYSTHPELDLIYDAFRPSRGDEVTSYATRWIIYGFANPQ